jgi:hypothetical protein
MAIIGGQIAETWCFDTIYLAMSITETFSITNMLPYVYLRSVFVIILPCFTIQYIVIAMETSKTAA